jgi:RHS repeat-associated protein
LHQHIHTNIHKNNLSLPQTSYLHKDSLGSIDTITNQSGIVLQRLAYQPHGKQITQNWYNETVSTPLVKRGYTGHEHIKEFSVIHMNGRVFDPTIARFLSADPYIQAPFNTQSFNRYTYTLNNPLKYTDPSGYNWDSNWGSTESIGFDGGTVSFDQRGNYSVDYDNGTGFGHSVGHDYSYGSNGSYSVSSPNGTQASYGGDIQSNIKGVSNIVANAIEESNKTANYYHYGGFGPLTYNGIMHEQTWNHPKNGYKDIKSIGTINALSSTNSSIGGSKFNNGAVSGTVNYLFNHAGGDVKKQKTNDLGIIGNFVRDVSGRLNSNFEKQMFGRYWNTEGDYTLSQDEFYDILSHAKVGKISENYIVLKFYHSDKYDFALGTATLYYSSENSNLYFYDEYDFNPQPIGERNYFSEFAT